MNKKALGITGALCLLAIVIAAGLAMPPLASHKPSQAKEWQEVWQCDVFAWSEYNGTYYVRCTSQGQEYYVQVDKSDVKRNTTERVYKETYFFKRDAYGTVNIGYIDVELRLDE